MSPEDTLYRFVITRKTLAGIGTLSRQFVIIIYSEFIIVHILFIAPPTTSCKQKLPITVSWLTYFKQSPDAFTFSVTAPSFSWVGMIYDSVRKPLSIGSLLDLDLKIARDAGRNWIINLSGLLALVLMKTEFSKTTWILISVSVIFFAYQWKCSFDSSSSPLDTSEILRCKSERRYYPSSVVESALSVTLKLVTFPDEPTPLLLFSFLAPPLSLRNKLEKSIG